MTDPTVTGVHTSILSASMPRPWVPEAPYMHVIAVDVELSDGSVGHGFTWTPTIGAGAVKRLIDDDIARFVIGRSADARALWPRLWEYLHEAGGGGLTTIAMAGVDLALWDAASTRLGLSLPALLGTRRASVAAYGSGVNLHYGLDELLDQVSRWRNLGYQAVKVKVGKPDLAEDIDRIAAVRERLGDAAKLRIDANQRWTRHAALRAITELARFDLDWVEEPLRADDTAGYSWLRGEVDVRIAQGENAHTIHRFRDLADAQAADILQPNVIRVGGITPFLDIAAEVHGRGLVLAPHLLPDLSAQLAVCLDASTEIEDVEDAGFGSLGLLASASPVELRDARAWVAATSPGLGLHFAPVSPEQKVVNA